MQELIAYLALSLESPVVKRIESNSDIFIGSLAESMAEEKTLTFQEDKPVVWMLNLPGLSPEIARKITKEEYEKVHIDDKDIEYLHNTLERVISLLSSFTSVEDGKEDSMKQLVALLNKDTLKTMQLLGFNYKEAIGEPLTEVCSNAIRNKLGGLSSKKNVRNKK